MAAGTTLSLVNADAATLMLDEPVDAAYFSLSYSVMPDRLAALGRAWETLRPGGRLVIMDAGIPKKGVARLLGPLAEVVATVFPGDPYSEPWVDLVRVSDAVTMELFSSGAVLRVRRRQGVMPAGGSAGPTSRCLVCAAKRWSPSVVTLRGCGRHRQPAAGRAKASISHAAAPGVWIDTPGPPRSTRR